jgi:hypothetical protein
MRYGSATRGWDAVRLLLVVTAVAAGGIGCLGEGEVEDGPEVGEGTAELEAELAIEDECLTEDVTFVPASSSSQACAGPWTYKQYPVATNRHPLCGTDTCILREECFAWIAQPDSVTQKLVTFPGINCSTEGGVTRCEPDNERAEDECGDYLEEREDAIEAQGRVTGSSVTTVRTSPFFGLSHTFRCTATVEWDKWIEGRHSSCDCEQWQYKQCTHAVRSGAAGDPPVPSELTVRVVSPVQRTKSQVRNSHVGHPTHAGQLTSAQIVPQCSTGQDVAALLPKLQRILTNVADPAIVPSSNMALRDEFVRRAKITYEMLNNTDVAALSSLHHDTMTLYYGFLPDVEPTCGRNKPPTTETCAANWALRLCTRLTSAHVKVQSVADNPPTGSGDLIDRLYGQCLNHLDALADGIEAGTCSAEGDLIDVTIDTHRRLHEKLLLRFGLAFNPKAPSVAALVNPLNLIDRWYAPASRVLTGAEARRAELALFVNKFWQAAHGFKPGSGTEDWIPGNLYAEILQELGDASPDLATLFQTAETNAFALDRAVLTAAYGMAGTQPVLQGAPLIHVTAAALAPLVERLEGLVQFHDVGCSLVDCAAFATPTKLSRFWKVLAHLTAGPGSNPDLGQILDATSGDLLGWKPAFAALEAAQQRLIDAAASEAGSPEGLQILSMIEQARGRTASYESTGVFLPAVGNRLYTGVHVDQRTRVTEHLTNLRNGIAGRMSDVENRFVSLVNGLVRVQDGATAVAQLEATEQSLLSELDDLSTRAAAFRAILWPRGEDTEETAESVFERLMAAWAELEGPIDEEAYLSVGNTTTFGLSGMNANFDTWDNTSVADISAQMVRVDAKRTVSIATDQRWAPSCALRDARLIDPSDLLPGDPGVEGVRIDPVSVPTGPEGYSIVWTGSGFAATSAHAGIDHRTTVGVRIEACASSPGTAQTGTGVRVCGYLDDSVTVEEGVNWQAGSDDRTSVQFASGIFVPTTPFEAPAGSLVVVEMPQNATDREQIRRIHLVQAPHTSIVVDQAADLYFVVNDKFCNERDDRPLEVTVRQFVGVGDAAEALLNRMAYAISLIDDQVPELMARGEMLPSEATDIELQAKFDAVGGPGDPQVPVDQYPQPLKDLFHKFLAREMTRLEAAIRLVNIERETLVKQAEYSAAQIAVRNATMSGYLLALLPSWSIRGMRLKELRDESSIFARDVRYYLGPMFRVWHPEVLADIASNPGSLAEVQLLTNVDVDTSAIQMAGWLVELGTKLANKIENAQFPYPSPDDTAPSFVSLRFPNPTLLDPACADSPSARCRRAGLASTFRWATVAQTHALWSALGQPGDGGTTRRLVFQPSPDDLYQLTAGTHYLSCTKSLPVVRKIGIALTGYTAAQLPGEPRDVPGIVPETAPMAFPDVSGVREFQLENPTWHHFSNVPLVYALNDYNDVETDFASIEQDVRGVSPFTTFVFEFSEEVVAEWNIRGAKTIDLILELEAIRASDIVAVPACTAAP